MKGNEQIFEALKAAREARGLSQRALAERVGLPQSHISKIERGGVDIQLSSLTELARALELELKLVPRKAVPAVESIIRQTAPTVARDQRARVREALSKAVTTADRLVEFDSSSVLDRIRDAAHLLQHLPVPADDLNTIQNVLGALRSLENLSLDTNEPEDIRFVLESPKVSASLKRAALTLRNIRNRAAHHPEYSPTTRRPAYTLDEEGDHG
jgi:transcriptional regulator with XRE-family HTH domain